MASRQVGLDAGWRVEGGDAAGAGFGPDGDATLDLPCQFGVAEVNQVHVATELRADVPGLAVGAALGFEISQHQAPVVLVLEEGVKAAGDRVALVNKARLNSNGLPGLPHGMTGQGQHPLGVITRVTGITSREERLQALVDCVAPRFPFALAGHDPSHLGWGLVVHHGGDRVSYPASPVVIAMNLGVKSQARYGLE